MTNDVSSFLGNLPRDYKRSTRSRTMSQEEKVRILAGFILARLYGSARCTIAELEADAAGVLSGRLELTIGAGVGGKGGMQLIRASNGAIVCCRDNAMNLLHRIGESDLGAWLQKMQLDVAALQQWIDTLPSVD